MANRIQLTGTYFLEEGEADGVVSPGMLLELQSTGKVKAFDTEGAVAERAFAVENALAGGTVDDDYADGDMVQYHLVAPGSDIQAILSAGEKVVKGDRLVPSNDGSLIKLGSQASASEANVIAVAREAKDLSASTAVSTLIKVRVL